LFLQRRCVFVKDADRTFLLIK